MITVLKKDGLLSLEVLLIDYRGNEWLGQTPIKSRQNGITSIDIFLSRDFLHVETVMNCTKAVLLLYVRL